MILYFSNHFEFIDNPRHQFNIIVCTISRIHKGHASTNFCFCKLNQMAEVKALTSGPGPVSVASPSTPSPTVSLPTVRDVATDMVDVTILSASKLDVSSRAEISHWLKSLSEMYDRLPVGDVRESDRIDQRLAKMTQEATQQAEKIRQLEEQLAKTKAELADEKLKGVHLQHDAKGLAREMEYLKEQRDGWRDEAWSWQKRLEKVQDRALTISIDSSALSRFIEDRYAYDDFGKRYRSIRRLLG